MSIEYIVGDKTYALSYNELRDKYVEFISIKDREFKERLPEALHLACIISYLKEIPNNCLVSDEGLLHMIAHQLHIPEHTTNEFRQMRKQFKKLLALAP
jgi:hypothetical protein